jgi:hypothetical protein
MAVSRRGFDRAAASADPLSTDGGRYGNVEPVPECVEAVRKAGRLRASLGHEVEEAQPVFDEDAFHTSCLVYWSSSLAGGVTRFAGSLGRQPSPDNLEAEATVWTCFQYGLTLKAVDIELAVPAASRCENTLFQ